MVRQIRNKIFNICLTNLTHYALKDNYKLKLN